MTAQRPTSVEIVEVGPRDGLQNDSRHLSTDAKVEMIRRLAGAGLRRIEAASFVNPKRVPQMADAEAVLARVVDLPGVSVSGLVLNERGFERALEASLREISFVAVATDTMAARNQVGMPLVDCATALTCWMAGITCCTGALNCCTSSAMAPAPPAAAVTVVVTTAVLVALGTATSGAASGFTTPARRRPSSITSGL